MSPQHSFVSAVALLRRVVRGLHFGIRGAQDVDVRNSGSPLLIFGKVCNLYPLLIFLERFVIYSVP